MSLSLFHAGRIAQACGFSQPGPLAWIPHLIGIGLAGVMDGFRGHGGPPCRGWIPAFAGTTGGAWHVYFHSNDGGGESGLAWIPHLIGIGLAGVMDGFRCHSGAPCQGWIPESKGGDGFPPSRERRVGRGTSIFIAMTEVGNLGWPGFPT